MVAAHCLYRFLESRWGFARAPDEALAQARHVYYRAFADAAGWPGHRFMPSAPWALPAPGPLDADEAARIRAKHLALKKTEEDGQRHRIVREMRREETVVRKGGWAVYASPQHRVVAFVKSPCGKGGNDPAGRLFLHTLDPQFRLKRISAFWREGRDCVVAYRVKGRSPVFKLRAGEWRGRPGGAVWWEAEFPFDSAEKYAAETAAYRREYEAFAEAPPRARPLGNWSAHVLDHGVGFLKDPCESGDLRGRFSLRMYLADPILSRNMYSRFAVVRVDGRCLLRAPLPPWAVATVWARQKEGEAVLWEATFHLDVERHRRAWAAVRSKAPTVRGPFDVHRRGAELVYVREPCEERDAAARFFLHVRAGAARTNLDFDFEQRGVLTDGRCVALAPLPEQDIDRIRTGQFVAGEGELWSVEL